LAGKLSELSDLTDPQNIDELEIRDDSETPDTDAQNKVIAISILKGLSSWKQPVRVATTTNGALATAYENGDTIDGVSLVTGNRILLKDQTAGAENGIYTEMHQEPQLGRLILIQTQRQSLVSLYPLKKARQTQTKYSS